MTDAELDHLADADFDYLSPEVSRHFHQTLADLRRRCPVLHSSRYGGHWVVTRYEDVVRVAQDWETFSSQLGVAIRPTQMTTPAIPEHIDPPLHRIYKRLVNPYFTPAAVAPYEEPTRRLFDELLDAVAGAGRCELMADVARPFPGRAFFELVLHAPPEEAAAVNELATAATTPTNPDAGRCWAALGAWIDRLVEERRRAPRRDDVVDAVLHADIEGRPITDQEVHGIILLLILGGLDTTAAVLGNMVVRFCRQPELVERLRAEPAAIPAAVEELLRLDGSFVGIGRTARHDAEIAGCPISAGDKVLVYWAAANRDPEEFPDPEVFDLARGRNRHVAFGAGPHRCAGSNLARLNLRVAMRAVVERLRDLRLLVPAEAIEYHTAFTRTPVAVPVAFRAVGADGGR